MKVATMTAVLGRRRLMMRSYATSVTHQQQQQTMMLRRTFAAASSSSSSISTSSSSSSLTNNMRSTMTTVNTMNGNSLRIRNENVNTRTLSSKAAAAKKTKTAAAPAAATHGGQTISALYKDNPHVDVVRYHHKNRTWTVGHVEYYSTALAIGLVENGLQPGDVVLSWLPQHFSEQMALQFACSKSGLVLYSLDPALAIHDPDAAKQALAAALTLTQANVFISQEAGDDVNYITLGEQVIPELRIFDTATGMPFITPRFPHLRFPIHTGFDQEDKWGWWLYKHMLVPSDNLDTFLEGFALSGKSPLAGSFVTDDKTGIPVKLGPTHTNEQVIKGKIWPTYCAILEKEFHEVEGVGVIF